MGDFVVVETGGDEHDEWNLTRGVLSLCFKIDLKGLLRFEIDLRGVGDGFEWGVGGACLEGIEELADWEIGGKSDDDEL